MKFNFWMKRNNVEYPQLIKDKEFKTYECLVKYSKKLGLIPPEKEEVAIFFVEEKTVLNKDSNLKTTKTTRKTRSTRKKKSSSTQKSSDHKKNNNISNNKKVANRSNSSEE